MSSQRSVVTGCFVLLAVTGTANTAQSQPSESESNIEWQVGPGTGQIGSVATIRIPESYRFAGRQGVKSFLEMTQNPVSGRELAVMVPPAASDSDWFVVFEFNSVGYVKDDDKNKLDPDALLASIKRGTEQANDERRRRGWATLDILGWHTPPRYDGVTNNLTWAIRGASEGNGVVNYSVRLLGRRGVMDVDLVLDPTAMSAALPEFDELLTGFDFKSGNRYAEFTAGDKVAEYGLTALVAGGAGAALAKSGLLGKIWKLVVFGAIVALAAIKRVIAALFGRKDPVDEPGGTTS